MEIFCTIASVTLAQIPSLILRYVPFFRLVTNKQKINLLFGYTLSFILQTFVIFITIDKFNIHFTPALYRTIILFGSLAHFCVNCIVIKKMFFQHFFVHGMQASFCLVLHSLVAIILGTYGENIILYIQLMIQSSMFFLLFLLAAYPLWKFTKKSFIVNISSDHNYYWNIIWLIPVLLYFSNISITMKENWIDSWQQFVSRIIMGITIFVLWKCVNLDFKELEEKLALTETNKLLHIQMEAIKHQAETISENDEKIRILRHDMRHNIQMLSSLIESGELSAASSILSQLNDNLESTKPVVFCKNPVINSSLLVYISKAQEENIEIISEIDIPQDIPWNSSDMAILFANVLENAINASLRQAIDKKEIRINTRYENNKLAIIVENRFDGEVLFGGDGMPVSKKEGHGIGMSSILTIVSKYNGYVVCSHKNGWFTISFMFSYTSCNS